jgi:hypothetical protein
MQAVREHVRESIFSDFVIWLLRTNLRHTVETHITWQTNQEQ